MTEDQGVARVLAPERAGEHDAGCKLGLEVLEAVHGEVDPPVGQGFMDLLGEEPLPADLGKPPVLHAIAGGGDRMLLEHIERSQHRAEVAEHGEERAGLDKCERRGASPDAQRQLAQMRPDPHACRLLRGLQGGHAHVLKLHVRNGKGRG